jgi:thiamine-monophosphate kinase
MPEFELHQHIYLANHSISTGGHVLIPPGDDMAMVRFSGREILAAVDQVIEGRHYRKCVTPIELVGRKAMTRCLSDAAAMAVKPVCSLAACTLPHGHPDDRARQLFDAMRKTAAHHDCPLVGGDIAFHASADDPLVCSVTVLAEPWRADLPPITRGGARAGDGIYVTGVLGGSFGDDGLGRHLTFEPRIALGRALREALGDRLHAMIDVSDGLGRDAGHIAELSRVRIELDAMRIPLNQGCDWKRAMSEGEDYELCFAASDDVPPELLGVPISRIGAAVDQWGGFAAERPNDPDSWRIAVRNGSQLIDAAELGWEHA